jgi:putative ABC transport system permease protein
MSFLLADLRFAVRTLARSPWFSVLAIVTLAVGIGATTALFSLLDTVLLRPLPYREPHRLVEIWGRDDQRTGMRVPGAVLEALRAQSKTLQAIGTHDPAGGDLRSPDGPVDIRGEAVSANFVDVFGVLPFLGRGFVPQDEQPGAPAVMLVSYSFFRRELRGEADAVGRTLFLDGVPHTIVGIMPPTFATRFDSAAFPTEFWTPYAGARSRERERELGYELVARLAPGVTVEQSLLEIEAIASAVDVPDWRKRSVRLGMVPLKEEVVGNRAYALQLLMAAVVIVLAIACANLAQLLLARSDRRLTEFATRKAVGAGTWPLFRLALCESLLLSAVGGIAGVVLAYWALPAMLALAPTGIPRLDQAALDGRVLAMAVATSVLTACAFGFVPALRLARLSVTQAMKPASGASGPRRARFRAALVVMQVGSAVTLFVLAGLVVQTFLTLLPSSPGFATHERAVFMTGFRDSLFPDAAERRSRLNQLAERVEATPGVTAAAVASSIPFDDDEARNVPLRRADDVGPVDDRTLRTEYRAVTSNFFQLLQMPLLQGRPFDARDGAESPRVAIVNENLARRLAPNVSVLGQSIRVGRATPAPLYQIIGVVADTRSFGTTLDVLNEVYTPFAQDRASFAWLVVHSSLDTLALTKVIRSEMQTVMPNAALRPSERAISLDEMVGRSVAAQRFSATLIGAFSALAFALAVIGLFGLVMYSMSERRRELGIRAALGAVPADLIAAGMRSAIALTGLGIVIGLAAGAYVTRFVESQLYAIEPLDLPTFAAAAFVMLAAAAVAAYVPAQRAIRNDPIAALRYE